MFVDRAMMDLLALPSQSTSSGTLLPASSVVITQEPVDGEVPAQPGADCCLVEQQLLVAGDGNIINPL